MDDLPIDFRWLALDVVNAERFLCTANPYRTRAKRLYYHLE